MVKNNIIICSGFSKKCLFIALWSFSGSLARKCVPLNIEPCMIRPTLINLNPAELNHYPLVIILDKYYGNCNVADDLYMNICVPSKTKDINVMIYMKI